MDGAITMLMQPMPGIRLTPGKEDDGSIVGFRRGGDEVLFVSWHDAEREERPMEWLPLAEFSPDPEYVRPPDVEPAGEPATEADDGTTEHQSQAGPFGGGGVRRRPGLRNQE